MKAKRRLGQILIQGLKKPKKNKKPSHTKGFQNQPRVIRLSLRELSLLSEKRQQNLQKALEPIKTPEEPKSSPVVEVQPPKAAPLPQVREPEVQLELPVQQQLQILQIQQISAPDLLRPNDRLKQSIEGFLLDQRSPHTRRAYQRDLKRFIQYLHGRSLKPGIEEINRTMIIGYKESLVSEELEHTTIDRHLATLRSFFKWLVDDGIITKSPADGVRFLNPKRISRTIGFSDEEVKRVLAIPNLHSRVGSLHYAILMVLFYCGLRRSELCDLRTTNLGTERDQRVLRLRGKGNAERVIVVVPPVWNAIKHYFLITRRSLSEDAFLFLPLKNNRTGVLDKALDTSSIFYIVTRYSKLAGISNRVSPHSCRATAISNARDHQVPDRAIQEFAGWASPDMITRYDKRKDAVENSAAHSIRYGAENRDIPEGIARTASAGTNVDVLVPQSESK